MERIPFVWSNSQIHSDETTTAAAAEDTSSATLSAGDMGNTISNDLMDVEIYHIRIIE